MISRRSFLLGTSGLTMAGCQRVELFETTPKVVYSGMEWGHAIRDRVKLPAPSETIRTDVLILGSGAAGLTAAWNLAQQGHKDFLMLNGPEFGGNMRGSQMMGLPCPTGAHYLPLPSMESQHVRAMLADVGVIEADAQSLRPRFDERVLLHYPDERLLINGKWQDGLIPTQGIENAELEQQRRFFSYVEGLKITQGLDGRKVFAIPIAMSSQDPKWMALDQTSFKQWLLDQGYTAPSLHWYLEYVCRDEYGRSHKDISAWSGLHYFAARAGKASNANDGAVLTWPNGLASLGDLIVQATNTRMKRSWQLEASAIRVAIDAGSVRVLCAKGRTQQASTFNIQARRVICAMPLAVATRVVEDITALGFDPTRHLPPRASWLVSNILLDGFPAEKAGVQLAWDNVLYQGQGLGYVVSTHQNIRVGPPPSTVFSAYQALSEQTPESARTWLAGANPHQLYEQAICDLRIAYGWKLARHVRALEINVRAHAMASPVVGFLTNAGLRNLRAQHDPILFAHSDLSGYSVFEEAAWWGQQAALRALS